MKIVQNVKLICFVHNKNNIICTQFFKEYSEKDSLMYPSNQVITLIQNVHNRLFHFCDENGHKSNLESTLKKIFFNNYSNDFCSNCCAVTLVPRVGTEFFGSAGWKERHLRDSCLKCV